MAVTTEDCITRFPTLWQATVREADPSRPLPGDASCDVLVIGAGYTGLAAAITLAAGGTDVLVIDAGYPGWGASGRNSGAVIRGFKHSRSGLIRDFGPARGRAMADFGAGVSDTVYALIARYGIDCDLRRSGWLLPAHNAAGLARVAERQRTWSADGIAGLEMLSRDEMAARLGSRHYIGGMIDRAGASLNPLAYARGLARAAIAEGARVCRDTAALAIGRVGGAGWQVRTPRGQITARAVIVATDAYSKRGLAPGIDRSLVTVHTNIVATAPLPAALSAAILAGQEAVSDSRRILYYWHKDPSGRLLFGTRGTLGGPRQDGDFAHVHKAMCRVYPQLADQPLDFRWSGRVSLTRDFLPHIDQPQPGLWTAHGYCGRGVAMATAYGRLLGETLLAGAPLSGLPVPNDPAPALPPAPLASAGVLATTQWYRLLDLLR